MERMLQQTLEELEQAKARLNQLEKAMAKREGRYISDDSANMEKQTPASLTPPLPVDEIKLLAEMAKRFK